MLFDNMIRKFATALRIGDLSEEQGRVIVWAANGAWKFVHRLKIGQRHQRRERNRYEQIH